jgi:hypothetical protein
VRVDQIGGAQVWFFPFTPDTSVPSFRIYLLAGDSGNTVFTNLNTQQSFTLQSRGGTFSEVANNDGTTNTTLTLTGHFVVVWYPTDQPSQTMTLYKGRAEVLRTAQGDILQRAVGTQTDICALIS